MHKTVADILRTITKEITEYEEAEQIIDNTLASCIHALRCVVNHTMKTSPRALVFQRDMLMDVPLVADLEAIRGRRQQRIDNNLRRTSRGRVDNNYRIGERVKLRVWDPIKLQEQFKGPYEITQVFTNGTVKLRTEPGSERVFNIRKIEPCRNNHGR